jgi:ribosomal protein S12 methylthiotransferase accessory factor YcaO
MFEKVVNLLGSPKPLEYKGAPGWYFYMLPIPDQGYLAFGAGETKDVAKLRCLGEAAEVLSVVWREHDYCFPAFDPISGDNTQVEAASAVSNGVGDPTDLGNEGVAAGASMEQALHSALWEVIERAAIYNWWQGQIAPHPICATWQAEVGLPELLAQARMGCSPTRKLRLLGLPRVFGSDVFIAVLMGSNGANPVLGYGAGPDPVLAAKKAISEGLQMELALTVALEAGTADPRNRTIIDRARALSDSHAALIASIGREIRPQEPESESNIDVIQTLGADTLIVDLTRRNIGVPVVRVLAPQMPSARSLKFIDGPSPL